MSDFLIRTQNPENIDKKYNPASKGSYADLKRQYDIVIASISKSDFANSPTALEKELSLIGPLKDAAKAQGMENEFEELENREREIYTKLANRVLSDKGAVFYKPVTFRGNGPKNPFQSNTSPLDFDDDKFYSLFSLPFGDPEAVKNCIKKLYDVGIEKGVISKIINAAKFKDSETKTFSLHPELIQHVAQTKKSLCLARQNEINEYYSPISHIDEVTFSDGKNVYVFQGNQVTYVTPIEGESNIDRKEEYQKAAAKEEDELLYSFVRKYIQKDGKIDSKYFRVLMVLMQQGITKANLLPMIDFCLDKNEDIDFTKISLIGGLKDAGALSKDIMPILDAARKPDSEEFDSKYIESAKALTATVMRGDDIIKFLNSANGSEEAQEYVIKYAQLLDMKYVTQLVDIVKDDKGIMNENAIDIVNFLVDNPSLQDEDGAIDANVLIESASLLINKVKQHTKPPEYISDSAVNAIFELCPNSVSVNDIMKIFDHCLDEDNYIDDTLAKIVWHMSWDREDPDLILEMIDSCKKDGKIDKEKAKETLRLFDDYTFS